MVVLLQRFQDRCMVMCTNESIRKAIRARAYQERSRLSVLALGVAHCICPVIRAILLDAETSYEEELQIVM